MLNPRARVLIVDDIPANLQLVVSILQPENYLLSCATDGAQALHLLQQTPCDLVLLDLHLPGMDGFEVCAQIKAQHPDIPVIFLTAVSDTAQVVKALAGGAVDYITKPFEALELLARVRTHLLLKQAQDRISWQNQQLAQLSREKTELMKILAHDLKNPLTVIFSGTEYLRARSEHLGASARRRLNNMWVATQHMDALVSNFLSLETMEAGQLRLSCEPLALETLLHALTQNYQEWLELRQMQVVFELEKLPMLNSDALILRQILENLFSNALKYAPAQSQIWLRVSHQPASPCPIWFEIEDQGPGIALEEQFRLFQPFTHLSSPLNTGMHSTGLGLSIVRRLSECLGGRITYQGQPGAGACFRLELPLQLPLA
jgi:two-component system sensor histidine kinase/response regulator